MAAAVLTVAIAQCTPQAHAADLSPAEAEQLLTERAIAHGASPARVLAVARCESSLDSDAIGALGERGYGGWLPGRGNHWDRTPAYQELGIDIVAMYRAGDPEAPWWDADGLAWSFGEGLTVYPGNAGGWSCP